MWTHSKKNLLETQMKRLVGRNGAKIVRTINICSLTKSQFMDLACLLIDTCSGTDKAPINDRKKFLCHTVQRQTFSKRAAQTI